MKRQSLLPMRLGAGAVLAVLIVGLFSITSLSRVFLGGSEYAAVITAVLVDLANADRASANVGTLVVSPILTAAAQAKANDMAVKGYFAHVSPEGLDSWHWFKLEGYSFTYAGENLAADFSDSADVERAWLNSPTHRANLMNGHFTEIGIATAEGTYQGHPTTFVVQMFGTPTEQRVAVATNPVRAINSPTSATEPALATTEPVSPVNVLGASSNVPTPTKVDTPVRTIKPHTVVQMEAAGANENGIAAVEPAIEKQAPFWGFLVAAPKTTLRYAYLFLGIVIIIALLARTGIEIKRHHMGHIAIAISLIVLMFILFLIADRMIFTTPELGAGASSISK